MMNIYKIIISGSICLATSMSLVTAQQYGWRGPDRSGVYNEKSLLKTWPAAGPELLWEAVGIGTGYSSVTIADEVVYITGRKEDVDVLTAFTNDGKKIWETEYGKAWSNTYPETRCTPTYVNGKLFLVSGQGEMVSVDKNGKVLWSVNYFQKYEGKVPRFGISESPLVVDNKVIGTPGGNIASMVAFNCDDGKVVWESEPVNDGTNYVNPILVEYGGKKIIVTLTNSYIIAVDAEKGKLLWKFNYVAQNEDPDQRRNHTITPVFHNGYLFVASGYDHVAIKLRLNTDGSAPSLVWKNNDIDPHTGGVILLDDYLYSSTWDNNSQGKWTCVDWNTGKTMWINEWYNKGSIISADGMIYIFEEKNGHVGLVKPGNNKLDVISEFRITKGTGPYWAHPVINKGKLYIRHGDVLMVYSLQQ